MRRAYTKKEIKADPVTEMAIVKTFTKLIFGDEVYTLHEQSIIEALRAMDDNDSRDSCKEMGEYLRSLGVREMIQLVSRLRQYLADCAEHPPAAGATPRHSPGIGFPAHFRDTPQACD